MDPSFLHRFEQPSRLVKMLRNNKVWLSSPTRWPDPYESAFLVAKLVRLHALVQQEDGRFHSAAPRLPNSITKHWISENCLQHRAFAMCFTTTADSERMWIAAKADNRIRWSIDPNRMMSEVRRSSVFAGLHLEKVDYRPIDEVNAIHKAYCDKYAGKALKGGWWNIWQPDVLLPLRTKRLEFRDEQEWRLVALDSETNVIRDRAGVEVSIPLRELVEQVALHPSATANDVELLQRELRGAGYAGAVIRSSLYDPPSFDKVWEKPVE